MTTDAPWEKEFYTRVTPYGTVLKEAGVFRFWYQIYYFPVPFANEKQIIVQGYATSRDGFTWEKPILGLNTFLGSKQNNVVAGTDGAYRWCHGASVICDPHERDPAKRYKMLATVDFIATSPDGIHWNRIPDGESNWSQGFDQDTHHVFFWDERIRRYRVYTRPECGVRKIAMATSKDFLHWEWHEPRVVLEATAEEKEGGNGFDGHKLQGYYNMTVIPYEGLYLGFPVHLYDDHTTDIGFLWSRDGAQWERPAFGRVYLPRGSEGWYDSGSVYPTSGFVDVGRGNPPGDEFWLYYGGFTHRHDLKNIEPGKTDSYIGIAVIRRDGFISLDAGDEGGCVTTKPLVVTGDRLCVNAQAAGGHVVAELLDSGGAAIHGLAASSCTPARGDEVRQPLSWRSGSLAALKGKTVRIRFHLRNCKLYSFWIQ